MRKLATLDANNNEAKIYEGKNLKEYMQKNLNINPKWNHRNFVNCVTSYINSSTEKILAIGGLRGTGKTVGILQATENSDVVYLSSQTDESEIADDYIIQKFDSAKQYINEAIVSNLAGYLKNEMSEEAANTLTKLELVR